MTMTPATNRQLPDHSIMDHFYKQTYLGNAYILPVVISLSDTSETPLVLMQNPLVSGAAFPVQKGIFVNLRRFSSSAQQVLIKSYFNPTVSSTGTKSTPVNLRPANANTSISKTYINGQFSVSGNGTLFSSIGCAASDYVIQDNELLFILDPGQTLLITTTALVETTSLNMDLSWYEM